jgi:hypothetical protein
MPKAMLAMAIYLLRFVSPNVLEVIGTEPRPWGH